MRSTTVLADSTRADRRPADRLLLRVGRSGGRWLALLTVTALVLAVAETLLPAVLGRAVDALVLDGVPLSWIAWAGVLVLVLVTADAVDDIALGYTVARSTSWMRSSLLARVLSLPPRTVARYGAGDLVSRLVGNASEAGRVAPQAVRVAMNLIPAVGSVVALTLIDPWLTLTFVAGLPALLVLVRVLTRQATEVSEQYMRTQGTIAARLVEALGGARTIAAAGTTEREIERVLAPLPDLQRHGLAMWRIFMRISVQESLVVPLLELAVLAVSGVLLARGRITPGELIAATAYAGLGARVGALGPLMQLSRSRAGAVRAAEVLADPPLQYGDCRLPVGGGHLELRGVTVRAGGSTLLDDIDLDVPAGALVGVVGRTQEATSTLVGLVSRLVDPDEGEVLLDGIPLQRLSRAELRRAVGHAFSQPVLIGDTIADVIAFGEETPTTTTYAMAARAAQADGFIRSLPAGYRTPLPQAPLSGGEVQRVGLARTFAHAGRVVILEDVASGLDTVTEHLIRQVLTRELAGRTRILVARRVSTADAADSVVWLDDGRIRAVAPHRELWREPEYRAIFDAGAVT